MTAMRLVFGALAALSANSAIAGTSVVGLGGPVTPLGVVTSLGGVLPIVGGGVLLVGAASVALGVYIARRKHKR